MSNRPNYRRGDVGRRREKEQRDRYVQQHLPRERGKYRAGKRRIAPRWWWCATCGLTRYDTPENLEAAEISTGPDLANYRPIHWHSWRKQ